MRTRLKTWLANGCIAVLLGLLLVQVWPATPEWLSWRPRIVADALGLWQGTWGMFTPNPDSDNHRLRAVIEYYDDVWIEWTSPVFREQSQWERFVGYRRSEYIDEVRTTFNEPGWPGFARWLAKTERPDAAGPSRVKYIGIYVDSYDIPDPRIKGWKRRADLSTYDRQSLMYSEDFP